MVRSLEGSSKTSPDFFRALARLRGAVESKALMGAVLESGTKFLSSIDFLFKELVDYAGMRSLLTVD